jgi:uncharacterized protein YjbJ (UPF0337 family)
MDDATRKSGSQIELEGKAKELGGKVKDALGDLTGNPRHGAEGKGDQVEGRAQQRLGEAQRDLEKIEEARRPPRD